MIATVYIALQIGLFAVYVWRHRQVGRSASEVFDRTLRDIHDLPERTP